MTTPNTKLYDILGLSSDADPLSIKKATLRLTKRYYPNKQIDLDQKADQFQEVWHAYEVLSDPERRRRYDLTGQDAP